MKPFYRIIKRLLVYFLEVLERKLDIRPPSQLGKIRRERLEPFVIKTNHFKGFSQTLIKAICGEIVSDQLQRRLDEEDNVRILKSDTSDQDAIVAFRYWRHHQSEDHEGCRNHLDTSLHIVHLTYRKLLEAVHIDTISSYDENDMKRIEDLSGMMDEIKKLHFPTHTSTAAKDSVAKLPDKTSEKTEPRDQRKIPTS